MIKYLCYTETLRSKRVSFDMSNNIESNPLYVPILLQPFCQNRAVGIVRIISDRVVLAGHNGNAVFLKQ